jgi:hypothetical protein
MIAGVGRGDLKSGSRAVRCFLCVRSGNRGLHLLAQAPSGEKMDGGWAMQWDRVRDRDGDQDRDRGIGG